MKWSATILSLCFFGISAPGNGADEIKIAVPTLSGHFDETADGRSAAALRTVFAECGLKARFVSHRWGQHWQAFEKDKSFDAVAIVWDTAGVSGFASNDFIHQKNGIVFMTDRGFDIKTAADLKGLKILGFGGATQMFPELAEILPELENYWEAPPGFAATQALVNGSADAFITDGLIFAIDYMGRIKKTGATYGDSLWPKMTFVGLFDENGDKMHFRRENDRDQFNGCLAAAQASGAIAAATKPYVTPFSDIVGNQVPAQ